MSKIYLASVGQSFCPHPKQSVFLTLFEEYERVIVESLITSFGLDLLIKDQHGGDVDTIHNVRAMKEDDQLRYKNANNERNYQERGPYNSHLYHSDKGYTERNRELKQQKMKGELIDAYTGAAIAPNEKFDLDHVISAKEIHEDPGRILAGLSGEELANSPENLQATNQRTNRSKKADSMGEFLERRGDEYTEEQKAQMREKDAKARKDNNHKIALTYYTGTRFLKDTALAAGNVSFRMGIRQALGFVFAEVWFSVKAELQKIDSHFEVQALLEAIAGGVKRGFENAKDKYREILTRFQEGALAGALSSIVTTVCNIFFTTAKNVVNILRQSFSSVVQAGKILLFNPDNLPLGERLRAALKILATGASVVMGAILGEVVGKTGVATIPEVGNMLQTFITVFSTGIMSCTLLAVLDRSELINKIVSCLNCLPSMEKDIAYFRHMAEYFEQYSAQLMKIDLEQFKQETTAYAEAVSRLEGIEDVADFNTVIKNIVEQLGLMLPYTGNFNEFMANRNNCLVFQ